MAVVASHDAEKYRGMVDPVLWDVVKEKVQAFRAVVRTWLLDEGES